MTAKRNQMIQIIGGGTISHVRNHLALCVPAYGTTAKKLGELCYQQGWKDYSTDIHLTKMADPSSKIETNEDVNKLVDQWIADPQTKIVFFNVALVDFDGSIADHDIPTASGKYQPRLKTSDGAHWMALSPSEKLISKIRKERKDIFLVAFKTTCGATEDEQFLAGLHLLKQNSCNLVLANDTKTRTNMIITPEQARYCVSTERDRVLSELVRMTSARAKGNFTHSTIVPGAPIPWSDPLIPASLRKVVDWCITAGAYKPFRGATVGHFAVKVDDKTFLTSRRKTNFNDLASVGLVKVESTGPTEVIAHGSRPSVGGMSQRIIFSEHPETDCILHFHVPPKYKGALPTKSQFENECGSMQCGQNTSDGLQIVAPGIKAVFLDNHGPNIVFNRDIDPQKVITFIDLNFDLSQSTDQIDRRTIQVS